MINYYLSEEEIEHLNQLHVAKTCGMCKKIKDKKCLVYGHIVSNNNIGCD